jgi:arylsulfatase A-like enzyme
MAFSIPSQNHSRVKTKDRPNLLWLFGDQHRHQATGYAGDPNLHTPNIDHLSLTGFTSERGAVSGYPLCCPFRGSLLSGVYPHHCVPVHEAPFPAGMKTIAHPFNEAGYDTAWFGKWHVDGCDESRERAAFWVVPPERRGGFQEWVGYENNNSQFDTWVHGGRGETRGPWKLEGFETDALTNLLIDYLERRTNQPDQPFFAALSVQPPHWPMQCPPEFVKFRPGEAATRPNLPPGSAAEHGFHLSAPGYYGMIENWDWNVGRILAALRRLDLAQNTHIVFFADHGDMLGSHGRFGKVLPYEESIRVPFIMGGADFFYNGLVSGTGPTQGGAGHPHGDILINHVDIAPTSLGLCGLAKPDWMEGYDFSFVRRRESAPNDIPDCALLQAIEAREQSPCYRGIVTRDGEKYACTASGPWLLFDLRDDPFEMNNLAQVPSKSPQLRRLHRRLAEKLREVGDPFPLPEPILE